MPLTALALNCSLKPSGGEPSSTDRMIDVLAGALHERGVRLAETIRLADHRVKPGVTSDEGEGDDWPALRARVLAHDILVFGTPIWLGHPCSLAQRVVERMDAFLSEDDGEGRTPPAGKVAVLAVVGNEDGAHAVTAHLSQCLSDVGWTVPASGSCYWVGEAMRSVNFVDLEEVPDTVADQAKLVARHAAHLAGLLKASNYPAG